MALYFEVFLLITFFERFRKYEEKRSSAKLSRYPSVTIIVPGYNEEKAFIKTINSLLALNYPAEKLSIMAVDDGSTDNTWEMLQQFKDNPRVQLFHKENGGKHTALNYGIKHSTSEFVGCLDADSFVCPEALNEIIRAFELDPELSAVTPVIKISNPQSLLQHIQRAEYDLSVFIRRTFSFLDAIFITPGPFSIFRREVFAEIGEYKSAHNTEDLEMALRMQKYHMRIGNSHQAFVYTHGPRTLRALIKQRVRWVYGFLKNFMDYKYMVFNPKYGHVGMLMLPISLFSIFTALFFAGLLIHGSIMWLWRTYIKVSAVGITPPGTPSFDWFFINTESMMILTFVLIVASAFLVVIGKKISNEKRGLSYDLALYVAFYGFIAPIWLAKATWNAMLSRKTSWTAEIDAGGR